jgi:regulatory protein YycI of two-component signal transduction system YycFG
MNCPVCGSPYIVQRGNEYYGCEACGYATLRNQITIQEMVVITQRQMSDGEKNEVLRRLIHAGFESEYPYSRKDETQQMLLTDIVDGQSYRVWSPADAARLITSVTQHLEIRSIYARFRSNTGKLIRVEITTEMPETETQNLL